METLLKQITVTSFKPSNFTVYNMIEDKGFITELMAMFNRDFSVEDFEYMIFKLEKKEKNGIYYRMSSVLNRFKDLKKLVEVGLSDDPNKPKCRLYIDKDNTIVMLVKLKEFDLVDKIEKMKNGDEQESNIANL